MGGGVERRGGWRRAVIIYFVSSRKWVIRSFLSLAFFRPPNAIFVPGMYFLGFSRYSNYQDRQRVLDQLLNDIALTRVS